MALHNIKSPGLGSQEVSPLDLFLYFAKLSAMGFGGPIALVGYMQRDLLEDRHWITDEEYRLGVALAQTSPGPLAAQLAIWIGYIRGGILGSLLATLAFIGPSFVIVIILSWLYVTYGGLWWVRALFYGIGPAIIAIMAIAAWKLFKRGLGDKKLLWAIFAILMISTAVTRTEIAWLFIAAGALAIFVYAPPKFGSVSSPTTGLLTSPIWLGPFSALGLPAAQNTLAQMALFFTKSGAFVFGSGLAIVPFLYHGVVQEFHWLTESQFLDAVAIGMITPGPVLIAAGFIGYVVAGFIGATVAVVFVFLPVYLFTVIPAPWFKKYADNPQLKAFADGVTAAAAGAIAGAVIVLARGAITDIPTIIIGVASLLILFRWRFPEPLIVGMAGVVGLLFFRT